MKLTVIVLCLIGLTECISGSAILLSLDFFKEKHVEVVCLLSCSDRKDHVSFIKNVARTSIFTSLFYVFNSTIDKDVNICFQQKYTHIGVILKAECPYFEDVMVYASENNLFSSDYIWLIIDEHSVYNVTNQISKVYYKLNLSVNADVTLAMSRGSNKYGLYEIFNYGKIQEGNLMIEDLGLWSSNTGLHIMKKEYKYIRRFDFQGLFLRLMIVFQGDAEMFRPEMILERELSPGISIVTQTSGMILHEVASIHNIRFNYSLCDRWVGDYKRESPYTVTNALYYRDIDITPILRFLPFHIDYYDVIHQPVTHVEARYFYRIPSTGIGKFENQFLTPFTVGVWWCVVGVVLLCAVGLLVTAVLEQRPEPTHYAIFSVVALTCQQSRKLTILITGLSCVLIYNYYTSSVVSWLLNGPPPSINSLWELLDSTLQPVFEDVGYTQSWLQLSDYYYNKKNAKAEDVLKKRIKKKGNIILTSPAEGVEMIKKGEYAFHCETNSANKYIAKTFTPRELCDLDSLHSIEKTLLYTALQKRSPYREFFVWSYARVTEQGIINLIHSRTNSRETRCEGSSPRALALGGAAPAFIVLGAGYILGTVIMFLERIKTSSHQKKNFLGDKL